MFFYDFFSELCSASTLFLMLSDLFDCITLDRCDEIFTFVEDRVNMWKSVSLKL